MSDNRKYYWLKLKNDFFQDKRIKKLRRIAGGDTFTIIYLKMQLLSLENDGILMFEGIESDFEKEIALTIDEDEDNVKLTISFLSNHGLLEEINNEKYMMVDTVKNIGKESQSAERVRRFRAEKTQKTLHCNSNVQNCNVEIEKELELELEKNKTISKSFDLQVYNFSTELNELIKDFFRMRNLKKKPLTDRAKKGRITELLNLSTDDLTMQKIVEQTIDHSWDKFYALRGEVNGIVGKDTTGDIRDKEWGF